MIVRDSKTRLGHQTVIDIKKKKGGGKEGKKKETCNFTFMIRIKPLPNKEVIH